MWRKQLCWVAMAGGGADVDLALERMATDTDSCAHCGKTGVVLKRCARCLRTWYCGAECQRAGWKIHKKTCVPLDEVVEKLITAPDNGALREVLKWKGRMNELTATSDAADWRGVLKLEGRMEELMEGREDVICEYILRVFCKAHQLAYCSTDDTKHSMKLIPLQERRVHLLGKMERFRDQADTICAVADNFLSFARREEAESYYKRARKVGEKHGFFSVECRACIGLGEMAMKEGRTTEGLELLRNAAALECLTEALFATNRIDEVEPLVPRYREASKADTRRTGRL
ncbi:hypothetical protein T484DRAFT_1904654 [Baffinella frigidus]|nr:hypothetical protein T484DRAFT_1904654 [Cryptophyta sp. CCMP2293]